MTGQGGSRFARIRRLFESVVDLPGPDSQRIALKKQGVDDQTLAEVMVLLGHADGDTGLAAPLANAASQVLGSELQVGDTLGAWTLQRELGSGGMGRVFLAARSDGHYEQLAAIKLLLGWTGPQTLERLTQERQILARLNHPHIARLLDGGTTPAGQPYLVMAFCQGLTIDRYCEARQLDLAARLRLFGMVCDAVGHAHRQLIVHCDIKPSNVLVNDDGQALLLDFGIARLDGQDHHHAPAMTRGYASPEQMAGQPPGLPSDIYSLGRLLEALLQPIAGNHRRGTEMAAIVARATMRAPEQRYDSVGSLQRDLQHLLAHRPVGAVDASLAYVSAKLLRRRWPWALAGVLGLLVSGVFTWSLLQQRDRAVLAETEARRESRIAKIERDTSRETSRFLMSVFTGADPKLTGLPDLPKSILLDKGLNRLEQAMEDDAALRARLMIVLGDVYERIGKLNLAIDAYRQAADLFQSPEIDQPLSEADALRRIGFVLSQVGKAEQAEQPARRALALREQYAPENIAELADAAGRLGVVLRHLRRFDEAAGQLERALQLRTDDKGPEDGNTVSTLHNLASLNRSRGQLALAEQQLSRVLEIKNRTMGPDDNRTLVSMELYGLVLSDLQRHSEAERWLRQAVERWTAIYGADNTNVAIARRPLGEVLANAGRIDEARVEWMQALHVESLAEHAPTLLSALIRTQLARLDESAGSLAAAQSQWREALLRLQDRDDVPALTLARARSGFARTLMMAGRPAEARRLIRLALAVQTDRLSAGDRQLLASRLTDAELALAGGDATRAAQLIAEGSDAALARDRVFQLGLLALRGRMAAQSGQPLAAARWLKAAWEGELAFRKTEHPALLPLGLAFHQALQDSGQTAAAQALWPQLAKISATQAADSVWRAPFAAAVN